MVEEADDTPLVLLRARGNAGDVLAVRDFPDLFRLPGGRIEDLVRLCLGAVLPLLAVDEEDGVWRDLGNFALQAWWGQGVREDCGRQCVRPAPEEGVARVPVGEPVAHRLPTGAL